LRERASRRIGERKRKKEREKKREREREREGRQTFFLKP